MVECVVDNGRAFRVASCLLIGLVIIVEFDQVRGRVSQGDSANKSASTNDEAKEKEFVALHSRKFPVRCDYVLVLGPQHNSLDPSHNAYGGTPDHE